MSQKLFPAHAGMNRLDGFFLRSETDSLFPAHAGMNRNSSRRMPPLEDCSPHTRG